LLPRRLAAILAADATNFSGLVAQNEDAALRALAGHRAAIDAAISAHDGRVFTTAGDSVLAEFASPVQAVRAAIEIQRTLKQDSDGAGTLARMHFRIGVNVGDVVVDGENILGDCVNVAVRLENLAPPGGICVSANVHDHVAGKLDCRFQDLGTQFLKHIPRPVRAYQLIDDPTALESLALRLRNTSRHVALGAAGAALLVLIAGWLTMRPPPEKAAVSAPRPVTTPAPDREELLHWQSVQNSTDPAELRTYLAQYPRGTFAELAKSRLDGMAAAEARRHAIEQAADKVAEAERAQQAAARLKGEADAAIERAATEQNAVARLRTEADQAAARAAAAAKAAEAQHKGSLLPSDRLVLIRTVSPLDGRWTADFNCDVSAEHPTSITRMDAFVQYREIRIEHGQVGLPGYFRAYATIGEDGSFQLVGTSLPRSQRIIGLEDSVLANGRTADLDHMEANGSIGKRRCTVALTRVAAQP
jgi:class 3 adenylate cyclase